MSEREELAGVDTGVQKLDGELVRDKEPNVEENKDEINRDALLGLPRRGSLRTSLLSLLHSDEVLLDSDEACCGASALSSSPQDAASSVCNLNSCGQLHTCCKAI